MSYFRHLFHIITLSVLSLSPPMLAHRGPLDVHYTRSYDSSSVISICLRTMRTTMIAFLYLAPNLRPRKTTTDPYATHGLLKYSIYGIGPVSDILFPTKSTQPEASQRSESRSARQSSGEHLTIASNIYRALCANLSTQPSFELPYCGGGFIELVTLER